MPKLLKMTLNDPKKRDKELAKPIGYGAPIAARTRSWLHKTGIIELRFPVRLTLMGEVVWENDPTFETLTTQWFMHWELKIHPTRSEAWRYFYHEFLPVHKSFTKEQLIDGCTQNLRLYSEEHFGPGSPLNVVIARKILEWYSENSSLGCQGLIVSDLNDFHHTMGK